MRVVALAALLLPFPVLATELLPPMVISARGEPQPLDRIPATVDIVDADDIAAMPARDLGDILRMIGAVELSRNGGPGQTASLFLRGSESDHTLVLLDGVPLQSGSIGATAIQHIDPALIERIEVLKGPRSSVWGSGAIGGVVHIITRAGSGGAISAGGDGTLRASVATSGSAGSWTVSAGLSHAQTDGFPSLADSDLDQGYRNGGVLVRADYRLDPDSLVRAEHWQAQGNNQYLGYFGEPLAQDFVLSRSSLEWQAIPRSTWNSRLQLSLVRDLIDQEQSSERVETTRWQADWRNSLALQPGTDLGFGLTISDEEVATAAGFNPYREDTTAIAAWGLWSRQWAAADLAAGLRYLDHEAAGDHWVWNLNSGYLVSEQLRLWGGVGTAFRYPSANERYGFGGNPDLQPEQSLNWELGLSLQPRPGHTMRAVAFHNEIDDLIVWRLTDPPFGGSNQNVAEARIEGLELQWQWQGRDWAVMLGGTWQDPRDLRDGSLLLRRARHHFRLGIEHFNGPWQIGVDASHSGTRKDFGDVELDPYTLVNLYLGYRLAPAWSVFAQVENLLDEDYELAAGYNTQERIGFVGLRFEP
jgi:vitamin B12 transporter